MVGAIIGGVAFGLWSDRIGRRRAMVCAFGLAILTIPLWAFSRHVALLVAGAFLIQFMVQGAWGVIPAHINELSPDSVRGFLPGFAYQCGVAVAGTVAYLQALFVEVLHVRYAWAMALLAVTVFSMAAVVTWVGPERSGVRFGV
jgi:SHS family lactate transporter-like MFS transporter